MQYWMLLVVAIVLEVAGTVCMKLSRGFTEVVPSVLIFVFYFGSFCAMTLSLKQLDVSLVYAVWAGLGTVCIAAVGIWYFHEPLTMLKAVSIGLIIAGVIGINLGGAAH